MTSCQSPQPLLTRRSVLKELGLLVVAGQFGGCTLPYGREPTDEYWKVVKRSVLGEGYDFGMSDNQFERVSPTSEIRKKLEAIARAYDRNGFGHVQFERIANLVRGRSIYQEPAERVHEPERAKRLTILSKIPGLIGTDEWGELDVLYLPAGSDHENYFRDPDPRLLHRGGDLYTLLSYKVRHINWDAHAAALGINETRHLEGKPRIEPQMMDFEMGDIITVDTYWRGTPTGNQQKARHVTFRALKPGEVPEKIPPHMNITDWLIRDIREKNGKKRQ